MDILKHDTDKYASIPLHDAYCGTSLPMFLFVCFSVSVSVSVSNRSQTSSIRCSAGRRSSSSLVRSLSLRARASCHTQFT